MIRRAWTPPEVGPAEPLHRPLTSVRNVAAAYVGSIAEAGVFLLLTPFLVREMGLAYFGMWSLALALADWLQLLDFGLREAVMKYVSAHQARREAVEVRRVADTALFFYVLLGVAAAAAGLAVAKWGLPYMVEETDLGLARAVVTLLVLNMALSMPAGITGTLLEGLSRFDMINLLRVIHAGGRLTFMVLALQLGAGIWGVALAEVTARVMLHALRWVAVARIDPVLVPWPWAHRGHGRQLLSFGAWNALRHGGLVAVSKLYEPILAVFAGLPAVGAFYAGRRLASMPAEMIVPVAGVLFPLSSEFDAAGRDRTLRQTLNNVTKIAVALSLPLCFTLGLGASAIQANWLGGRAPQAVDVIEVFAAVFLVVAAVLPAESILLGLGRARLLALVSLAQGALTVGLGVLLTWWGGAVGLALAGLVAVLGIQALVEIPVAARACGQPVGSLLRRAVGRPLLAAAPAWLVLYALRDIMAVGGLAALVAWAGGGLLIYSGMMWWVGFDTQERAFLRSHLRRLVVNKQDVDDWEIW